MDDEFDIDGDDLFRTLTKISLLVDREGVRIMREIAEPRATKMKDRTPVMRNRLRASVHAQEPKMRAKGPEVRWVAGGSAKAYALRIHEDKSLSHTGKGVYYRRGKKVVYDKRGQAKFITSVMDEDSDEMKKEAARKFAGVLYKFKKVVSGFTN